MVNVCVILYRYSQGQIKNILYNIDFQEPFPNFVISTVPKKSLLILDDCLQQYPDREDIAEACQKYRQAYILLELYGTPFENKMCGLWVSMRNDNTCCSPIFALVIYQDNIGNYVAELNEKLLFL